MPDMKGPTLQDFLAGRVEGLDDPEECAKYLEQYGEDLEHAWALAEEALHGIRQVAAAQGWGSTQEEANLKGWDLKKIKDFADALRQEYGIGGEHRRE
jgi:hypothetical protein